MHLIRYLFFLEAWFGFELVASYLPGSMNTLADDLSRNRLSQFLSKAQSPELEPAGIPLELPELLLEFKGWTSPLWTKRFASIVIGD